MKKPRTFRRTSVNTRKVTRYEPKQKEVLAVRKSAEYKAFHKAMIDDNPICAKIDCYKPSTDIHHIKRVADFPDLVFDPRNVICVCGRCHDQIESAVNRGIDHAIWAKLFEGLE